MPVQGGRGRARSAHVRQPRDYALDVRGQGWFSSRPRFTVPVRCRRRNANRPPPVVERIEDIRFAELDPHWPPARAARFEPRATSIDTLERHLEGHAGGSPAGYQLERGTHDSNQVTVIPLAQVSLHLPGVLRGIVHAC
jgi:hypothetical protein